MSSDSPWQAPRTCQWCGKEYVPTTPNNTHYCSRECYKAHFKTVQSEYYVHTPPQKHICPMCNEVFYGNKKKKYCSGKCKSKAYRCKKIKETKTQ